MGTTENWLVMSTCGISNKNKTSFSRTSLLDVICDRIGRVCDGIDAIDGAPIPAIADECDPMTEIGSSTVTTSTGRVTGSRDTKGRTRYYQNRAKNCIITVNMPIRCIEIDPNCTQMRPVKLFVTDRKTVWMSVDDVEWAMRYLFNHNQLKGVPLVGDSDAGPGAVMRGVVHAGQ